MKSYYID